MEPKYLNFVLGYIKENNPMHYKKLKKGIDFSNMEYVARAETFFKHYEELLQKEGKDFAFAIDCYLRVVSDTLMEQIKFFETGKYTSTSFDEVNERVYGNPEVMSYYMHGLLVSEYLWSHHYKMLEFFFTNINNYESGVKYILEIGGGHGLFTCEILERFKFKLNYTMVDISETSIALSKTFIKDERVSFILEDVYKYQTDVRYDFIIMGEVLEHVEDPLGLMKKLHELGSDNATAFITVPCNGPAIDHIYLFRNPSEIIALYKEAGWEVAQDLSESSEKGRVLSESDPLVAVMYAAFLKKIKV